MNNEFNKAPVFLIDLHSDDGYALFPAELNAGVQANRLSRHSFILGQTAATMHRYLGITLFGYKMFWGGDSELRPLGKFTSKYIPIEGRAITLSHYFEILAAIRGQDDAPRPQVYSVEMDDSVREILRKDRYEGWHQPSLAMRGYTRSIYNLCPFTQTYVDAAPADTEGIPAAEFVSMYKATYTLCEPMDFSDYRELLGNAEEAGKISRPVLDNTTEGQYYNAIADRPAGIIKLPGDLGRILPRTFKNCDGITDVIIPEGLIAIDPYAFCDCGGLRRIYLPKSIKQIHFGAFHNCFSLVEVYYAGSREEWKALCMNNISDKAKQAENGIARFKNKELLRVPVHFDCEMRG